MTPDFNIADSSTWPVVLNVVQIAAIYQRAVGGVKKACQRGLFQPAPFQSKPYRFRKTDVLRQLESGRVSAFGRRAS